MKRKPGIPFLVLGIVFLTLSRFGQKAFFVIGLTCLVIGLAFLVRQRRERS
jgi:hypothetical protein